MARAAGPNDQLSSVRVDRGWKITLYEHANFTGRTKVITADTSFVGWDFNNITSAVENVLDRILCARKSPNR